MIISTTENLPGKHYEVIGIVQGSTIQSKNFAHDISQSLKTIVGGELKAYTDMMDKARQIATERMTVQAQALGADAIVSVRYTSSAVMAGAAEILAYGTAVKLTD